MQFFMYSYISWVCKEPATKRERDEVKRVKYGEMNYGYFTRKSPAYEVVFTCILQLTSRPASNNFVKKNKFLWFIKHEYLRFYAKLEKSIFQ